jgi:hypothetical protein
MIAVYSGILINTTNGVKINNYMIYNKTRRGVERQSTRQNTFIIGLVSGRSTVRVRQAAPISKRLPEMEAFFINKYLVAM